MPAAVRKPVYQERYRIHAYVRHGGVLKRQAMRLVQGRVTFAWVYQNRPDECRYAIVSTWDINDHQWRYEVLDLFGVLKNPEDNQLIEPKPRWTHDDLDAAIMTTVLMYGDTATCNNT